jgi:hypothetical protein
MSNQSISKETPSLILKAILRTPISREVAEEAIGARITNQGLVMMEMKVLNVISTSQRMKD